jgi:hypothetical protein
MYCVDRLDTGVERKKAYVMCGISEAMHYLVSGHTFVNTRVGSRPDETLNLLQRDSERYPLARYGDQYSSDPKKVVSAMHETRYGTSGGSALAGRCTSTATDWAYDARFAHLAHTLPSGTLASIGMDGGLVGKL